MLVARYAAVFVLLPVLAGCGSRQPPQPSGAATNPGSPSGSAGVDAEKVRAADFSILFVGNSHTSAHDLPNLVANMIQHQQPGKTVHVRTLGVGHLEDLARSPHGKEQLEAAPWKFVVLQ